MSYQCISKERPKARKQHQCTWCYEFIAPGEIYDRERGVFDGDPQVTKMHLECDAAAGKFFNEYGEETYEPGSFKRGTCECIHD